MSMDTTGLLLPKPEPRAKTKRRQQREDAEKLSAWRDAIWARDVSYCRCCGVALSRALGIGECAHIVSRRFFRLRYDRRNGLLLCPACHAELDQHRMDAFQVSGFRFQIDGDPRWFIDGDKDVVFM